MLYLIGLGLADERDITVKGLECIKRCSRVYLENYTSILLDVSKERLESFYGRGVVLCDREDVELRVGRILEEAKIADVAFLVVGDPFGATTHSDLFLRAHSLGVSVKIVHNASILNAVGESGLQLYNFGITVSIPFFTEKWRPDSFYDRIAQNDAMNLHSLCLLDIKVKEQSEENLFKGILKYEPPRFMTATQALEQLVEVESKRGAGIVDMDRMVVVIARLGSNSQKISSCTVGEGLGLGFGAPLHSLIIPSRNIHDLELAVLNLYRQ